MKVGVPKEIKNHEYRVGLTPASVRELTLHGHDVYVQSTAGEGIGVTDDRYEQVGATILPNAEDVFDTAEMIVKVKRKTNLPIITGGLIRHQSHIDAALTSGAMAVSTGKPPLWQVQPQNERRAT